MTARLTPVAAAAPAALLTVGLGLAAGGFFPGATAVAALMLCAVLVVRVTATEQPLAGLGPLGVAAGACLAAYAGWVLASSLWSHAPGRALVEFDRALLYVLAFTLTAVTVWDAARMRVLLRALVGAMAVVSVAGLTLRLLPGVVGSAEPSERLSAPIGYWNAMGLIAGFGAAAALTLSADPDERPALRAVAAAAVPLFAVSAFLTLSRGGILAGVLALGVATAFGRPRLLIPAMLATVPAAAICVRVAARADGLVGFETLDGIDGAQGRHVAAVLAAGAVGAAVLRVALSRLDRRLIAAPARIPWGAGRRAAVLGVVVAAAALAVVATGLPAEAREFYDRATDSRAIENERQRLLDPGLNGRPQLWRVARDTFADAPLHGSGAGTFELRWNAERKQRFAAMDAHSLYMETLAELGLPGLALLVGALAIGLVGVWRRRREDRVAWSLVLGLAVGWLVHTGVDWDWELPAVTAWVFAAFGAACARREPRSWPLSGGARVLAGLALVLVAIGPARLVLWQHHADAAVQAFRQGDCPAAVSAALRAIDAAPSRPEPFELLGYCDVRLGRPDLAVRMVERALARDPGNWELLYELALVRGAAGLDPRPQALAASRANPHEPVVQRAVRAFATGGPARWRRAALASPLILRSSRPE